ncbi:hypothetical protein ZYGR_0AG02350 [Zygosaccharomyces rouxii]|uniref:N-terminal acetyltransferase B complex subunit MDM20 n=1 Tax=Zygosaccharomyces rouxii TaxID=4956 RepID=A0A1Q3A939_ZYGRO|nr:hypothetical protein ZYGR_0AG02350 [Zygosaccharomyces rouxii]
MGDRLEQEVFQLIEKSNFKACNAKINDWKRKYPSSTYIWVLETYVRYRQSPSKFNYDLSLGQFFGLQGTQITSDLRALKLLHDMFLEMQKYDEALHIYEKANFKYPSFEVAYEWFCKSLDDGNYKMMARACQQMAKLNNDGMNQSIRSRDYKFWYAICTIALFKFQRSKVNAAEEKLLPQLALRSLESQKPFKSTQEIIVYCYVCQELFSDKSQEIVDAIWPQLNQSLDLYCKNFLIRHINDDSKMLEACKSMLNRIDDFELLCKLTEAAHNLSWNKKDVIQLVDSSVGDSRNTRLCRLEIDLKFDNEIGRESLTHYLSKYHNKPCCPHDLSHFKDQLNEQMVEEVFHSCKPHDVIHDTNAFKLGFLPTDSVTAFQKHKSTLVNQAKTDYSTLSGFIMDVVQGLVIGKEPTLNNVLLALSVLENYQNDDPFNYETSVWIIALYMHLGLVPAAYSRYLDLKVKNLQNDSVNFILYSRFATLFPQKEHDYLRKFRTENYRLYSVSGHRLPQFIHIAMERRAYSKLLGMFEFKDRIVKSSMKWMNLLEELQLARLCNDKRHALLSQLTRSQRELELVDVHKNFSDNRDWAILGTNIDPKSLPAALKYLDINQDYISLKTVLECIIELVPSAQQDSRVDEFLSKTLNGKDLETTLNASLTPTEIWTFKIFYDLYKNDGAQLGDLLNQAEPIASSSWRLTHDYLTKLSTLKTLDNFKRVKDKQLKQLIKNQIHQLRDRCDQVYEDYTNQLVKASEELNKGSNRTLLDKLGYVPLSSSSLQSPLLTVLKTVRNL